MPKKNIPLLKRLRTRFLRMRHPKHFDMNVVAKRTACGTAMCIAGHVLNLQGYKLRFVEASCGKDCCGYQSEFFSPSGRRVHPLRAAAREMGLFYKPGRSNKTFRLFHDYGIRTPKQAAKRIERLISDNVAR